MTQAPPDAEYAERVSLLRNTASPSSQLIDVAGVSALPWMMNQYSVPAETANRALGRQVARARGSLSASRKVSVTHGSAGSRVPAAAAHILSWIPSWPPSADSRSVSRYTSTIASTPSPPRTRSCPGGGSLASQRTASCWPRHTIPPVAYCAGGFPEENTSCSGLPARGGTRTCGWRALVTQHRTSAVSVATVRRHMPARRTRNSLTPRG
mmetsp:Transcript_44394/g.112323  ORF Transcript_44394/g.112323 Transcript_44394/m.112323 type:complete len:210 (-) Transcript_44394:29-658(-)